ncbi:protein 5NUC isoform X1 [Acyrthosiphon pisum]|uniref:5'-nucleotidase n=1 Tax=Acyrthosiphon pisum TaxID=7029 RepID=A0A8R2B9G7_ACYPI|nr:protein 5NUC isoform X1 [Acyrthosiphon pisum]|eukprot:XP_008187662.1 PREDICTED: protein 5NUC isoform X1 [Acyrthosiphon pisum]
MRSTAAACLAAVVVAAFAVDAADLDLVLLHANDMHSRFDETDLYCNECREDDASLGHCYGGFARVAQFVRDERRLASESGLPSLFLVAGDTFQGTPYFSFFEWRPVVDFINQLQPDVMTLGNHEFDHGINTLLSYLNGIQDIPTVVSNLNMTAEPELNNFVLPSLVFTINNTKVGIVGCLTTDTPTISNSGAVEFFDEVESLKKETKKLLKNGVNIIICLSHSGIEKDKVIAKEVEDIDIIVGGHSHTFLYSDTPPSIEKPYGPYPLYVTNVKNKAVPILQAYANTKYVGKVVLKFDSNGDIVNIDGSPTLLNHEIKQDPTMLTVVDQWKPQVTRITNITIGRTAVELINTCRGEECNIGNLIADSYVYYNVMKKEVYNEYWTDAPIGMVQAGGIRTTINETDHDGYITLGQLINVTPFANNLVKITISGSTLLESFEHSVSDYVLNHGTSKFLQVSGVLVEYDLTQSPGNRVTSLFLRCGHCSVPKYEPLVLTANYTIVMSDYLANGGNNYQAFQKRISNELLGIEDYNATSMYMQSISPITSGIDGRIHFKRDINNEKSAGFNINTWNYRILVTTIIITVLYFNI